MPGTEPYACSLATVSLVVHTRVTVRLLSQPDTISAATRTYDTIGDSVDTVIAAYQMGIPMVRIELMN